jgi:hypothetical protein
VNGSQITGTLTNHKTLRHADIDTFLNFQREIASQASPANLVGIARFITSSAGGTATCS